MRDIFVAAHSQSSSLSSKRTSAGGMLENRTPSARQCKTTNMYSIPCHGSLLLPGAEHYIAQAGKLLALAHWVLSSLFMFLSSLTIQRKNLSDVPSALRSCGAENRKHG